MKLGILRTAAVMERTVYYAYAARARAARMIAQLRPMSGTKRKLLILDPSLIGYAGHHAEFVRILMEVLASDFDIRVYGNFCMHTGLMTQFKAQPVFFGGVYAPRGSINFQTVYHAMTQSLIVGLRHVNDDDLTGSTIAVMHTATIFQLGGLAEWFSTLPITKRPKLFILFHLPLEFGISDRTQWAHALSLARNAAVKLAAAGTVRFASFLKPLAERLSTEFEQPCAVMPLPVRWPNMEDICGGAVQDGRAVSWPVGLTFGFFGGLRLEKGAALLAEAIPRFTARFGDVRFIIHAPPGESDQDALQRLEGVSRVEVIRTSFRSREAYLQCFLSASCILLPYEPSSYASRMSVVLLEALGLGRMIITTKGTWLETVLRDRGASAFLMSHFTAEDLFSCLEQARVALLRRSDAPVVDRGIVSENNPAAFCSALVKVMS